jgi:hypothetical protein
VRRAAVVLSARLASVLPLALLVAAPAVADTELPYAGPFLEELRGELFSVESGRPSDPAARVALDPARLADYRARIQRKLRFVRDHVERYERIERGRSAKKARKRAESRDSVIALRYVLELLDALEAESDPVRQQRIAADAMTVEYATRSYAEPIRVISIPVHLLNIVFDWSMPAGQRSWQADREAANLVNPATGGFYTPRELRALMREGVDLSTLDPPDETLFWRAIPDIGLVDITQHYLGGGVPVQHGAKAVFPPGDSPVFEFDGMHLTQSKPKIDVVWSPPECLAAAETKQQRKACEASYKLKLGMETHADPTANALLAGLGYNADLARHFKNVRIDLGDFPYAEVERQWIAYFDQQRTHTYIPIESVLLPGEQGRGRDEQGDYIVFQEAVAEYKPSEIERIGMWPFSEGVASTSREARGLQLFNIWIANADMKDEENNKLSLRRDAEGEMRIYLTQQDIGHSFGVALPERADVFPWEAFESSWWSRLFGWIRGRKEINYFNLQQSGLEYIATWADSKWMARRIAQLTRPQIEEAVALGRWPGGVGPLYVERLVNRRNQMVRVFDLEAEYGQLPVDRYLTTPDGSVVDGELLEGRFPEESPIDFGRHHADIFGPVLDVLGDGLMELVQVGVGSVDEIDPGTFELTGEFRIAPEVVVKLSRRVYENPEAEGAFDQHVVQDTLRIGFRIGLGNTGFAQGGWSQALSLAYPVATRHEGLYAKSRLLPLLSWRDIHTGELPERYVLARERMWHVGARVRSSEDVEVTAGADLSHDRVFAWRTVVDHRDEAPLVYRDDPRYWSTRARAAIRLGVVDIPFIKLGRRSGEFEGRAWRLDPARLDAPSERAEGETVFRHIVRSGEIDEVERVSEGPAIRLDIDTRELDGWMGIFIASLEGGARRERVLEQTEAGEPIRREWRDERRGVSTWNILGNGERQEHDAIALQSAFGSDAGAPGLRLRWQVDDLNTHSDELDRYYGFLRGLAPAHDFVAGDFVARDWEVSGDADGRWTRMKTTAELHLQRDGLAALCSFDPERFDQAFAHSVGLDRAELARLRARFDQPDLKRRSIERRRLQNRRGERVRRAQRLQRALERSCAQRHEEDRLAGIGKALFAATPHLGATFEPSLVGALLSSIDVKRLAADGQLLLEGRMHKAFEDENNLPERRDLIGRIGKPAARVEPTDYHVFPRDGVEQWKQLDWLRATLAR